MRGTLWVAAALALCVAACGPKLGELEKGETGKAADVRDGDTLELADGLVVHLAGVEAPRGDQPRAAEARAALEKLVAHRDVQLAYGGQKRVREAAVAHVFARTEGGRWVWVQQAMLLSGDARVRTRRDQSGRLVEMLKAEEAARVGKRGLWADAAYAVRPAASLARSREEAGADPACVAEFAALEAARAAREKAKGEGNAGPAKAETKEDARDGGDDAPRRPRRLREFQVVEGRVSSVAERERALFVNFGDDISRDFALMIPTDAAATWPGGADAIKALAGKPLRVRGDVPRCAKPLMRVDHPAQIEVR